MTFAETKQHAYELIDRLAPNQVSAVVGLLESMVEPMTRNFASESLSRSLATVPVDEEELNAETISALKRAGASLERGEGISHGEVLQEFGL